MLGHPSVLGFNVPALLRLCATVDSYDYASEEILATSPSST